MQRDAAREARGLQRPRQRHLQLGSPPGPEAHLPLLCARLSPSRSAAQILAAKYTRVMIRKGKQVFTTLASNRAILNLRLRPSRPLNYGYPGYGNGL